jgi:hypothetical protein
VVDVAACSKCLRVRQLLFLQLCFTAACYILNSISVDVDADLIIFSGNREWIQKFLLRGPSRTPLARESRLRGGGVWEGVPWAGVWGLDRPHRRSWTSPRRVKSRTFGKFNIGAEVSHTGAACQCSCGIVIVRQPTLQSSCCRVKSNAVWRAVSC